MNVLKWCEVEAEYILKDWDETQRSSYYICMCMCAICMCMYEYIFLLINKYDECDLEIMVVLQHAGDDRRGTNSLLKGQDCTCRNELCKASEERNCKDIFKNVN